MNPRATAAGSGWSSNNGAIWTCTKGEAITGHPAGITTAAKCALVTAVTNASVLSLFNIDTLSNSATARTVGVWVWVNASGYRVRVNSGSYVNLSAATWTYVQSSGSITGWSSLDITTVSGANAGASDYAYATGSMAVSGATNYQFADGNSTNWVWNGTAGASTSTGPSP